ncbi:CHAD domain-containing protein [Thermanaerovibrio velox]|uniref:CHAD domain-containing protein n=1 Tax=Thermanaerovibrio velox TaxID=108007 RepID=UPI00031E9783|nr:CHAD domain-containing protein [Thermanaerovibrio velox]
MRLGVRFCAGVLRSRLKAVRAEVPGVRENRDVEALHRMRVASRRARVALWLFGPLLDLPDEKSSGLKGLTGELGRARDLDVQGEWLKSFAEEVGEPYAPGVKRFLLRINQRRLKEQKRVLHVMDWLEGSSGLCLLEDPLEEMMLSPDRDCGVPGRLAFGVSVMARRVVELGAYLPGDSPDMHHRMRIRVKVLRYGLEICSSALGEEAVSPLLEPLKALQRELGREHDGLVWASLAERYLEKERKLTLEYFGHTRPLGRLAKGFLKVKEDRLEDSARGLEAARRLYGGLLSEGFFDRLLSLAGSMAEVGA